MYKRAGGCVVARDPDEPTYKFAPPRDQEHYVATEKSRALNSTYD